MNIDKLITENRKNGNNAQLEICQLIKAAFIENEHAKKSVSEIEVLQKMVKEREKAIDIYTKVGRKDLLAKEIQERDYIKTFLPKEPSKEQIILFIKAYTSDKESVSMKEVIDATIANFPTAQKGTIAKLYQSLISK